MTNRATFQAISTALLLLFALPSAAADDAYDNATVDGNYRAHDLFALRDGEGQLAVGTRDFNGAGRMSGLVDFAGRTPIDYDILGDGRVAWSASGFQPGTAGSIGLGGGIVAYAPSLGAGADNQVPRGYAALRLSLAEGAGYVDADFKGNYSYHALLFRGERWWNVFGGADVNGTSRVRLVRGTSAPFDQTYNVNSNGSVTIGSGSMQAATILADGDLVVQLPQLGPGVDALYSAGYDGLAFYLRRGSSATPFDPDDFQGSYNIVELRVKANGNVATRLGRITAGPVGIFFGALGDEDFDGQARFFDSGVFTVDGFPDIDATMSAGGDVAVVTDRGGLVNNGAGEAFVQVWLRVAGGAPTANDSDGDGLSDDTEEELGTDPFDRDSDGDGMLDNEDDAPLDADNEFTAVLSETALSLPEGASDPDPLSLELDANGFPYFTWSLTDDADWLRFSESSGAGDAQVNVILETASLAARAQPYEAIITIAAPGMRPVAPITLSVLIREDSIGLTLTPGELNFAMAEGGPLPAAQTVRVAAGGLQNFAWSITAVAPWLRVQPTSGTGPRDLTVSVLANALPSDDGPYASSMTVAVGEEEAFATAFLRVYPERGVGVPFLAAESVAVEAAALGLTDTESVLLYADGADCFAIPFDDRAVPRSTRMRMDGPLARITGATAVAINPALRSALCLWEESPSTNIPTIISARKLNLQTLGLGNAFVMVSVDGDARGPRLSFDSDRARYVMAYVATNAESSNVRVGFFAEEDARDVVFVDVESEGDEFRVIDSVALALNTATGDALVCWRELDTSPATNGQGRIMGRVARADGTFASGIEAFNAEARYPEAPAATYDTARPGWVITWQEATRNGDELLETTRYAARQASLAPAHDLEVPLASTGQRSVAVTYSPASRRVLGAAVGEDSGLNHYRVTPQGNLISGPTALGGNDSPYLPSAYTTPDGTLHWLVYGAGSDVFAVRLAAGDSDTDDDGLEDDWEIFYGLDPESAVGIDGGAGDPDFDLLTNEEEQRMGTNPRLADTDNDGLLDRLEDEDRDGLLDPGESSATSADTDGDGASDAIERFAGTDPGDPNALPESGIYGIEYGPLLPGTAATLRLRVFVRQANTYRLALNPTDTNSWSPPMGWAATASDGTERTLSPVTHLLALTIVPPAQVTPINSHGIFQFVFTGAGVASQRTAELVCDARPASGLGAAAERALAEAYAPVLRLATGERFGPTPVALSAALATLRPSEDTEITRALGLDGPALQPFVEATLDQPGDSVATLRSDYAAAATDYPAEIYYTVTGLQEPTAAASAPPPGTVLQFYIHFFADDWEPATGPAHRHEGDWEALQITFTDGGAPRFVTLGQHLERARAGLAPGTVVATWDEVEKHTDGRPIVYAGRGNHALHFTPGGQRIGAALDAHDGLGPWCVPRTGTGNAPVSLGYAPEVPYNLVPLPRLGNAAAPGWLRFAGTWGQRGFPQSTNAEAIPGAADGPRGPLFLGTGTVPSIWVDPYAWEQSVPPTPVSTMTSLRAHFLDVPEGTTAFISEPRGLALRVPLGSDGRIQLSVPVGVYWIALTRAQPDGSEAFYAIVRGLSGEGPRTEIVLADRAVNELGNFAKVEGTTRFEGPANWAVLDLDGDGINDNLDDDINGNGAPTPSELDVLGDGWPDAYQFSDYDNDLIPAYFDADDDGDGVPDALDDDANGNGVPDVEEMPDTDGDGVPDPYDVDMDNDTFTNAAEIAAGSDPRHPYDTPIRRICDVDGNGEVNAADAQLIINAALGRAGRTVWMDANEDGRIQAMDIAACIQIILENRN